MFNNPSFLASLFVSAVALAGSQQVEPLAVPAQSYRVSLNQEKVGSLEFVGTRKNNDKVQCKVNSLVHKGKVANVECGTLYYKCDVTNLRVESGLLVGDVSSASLTDVEPFETVVLGHVSGSGVFNWDSSIKVQGFYVQERYNPLERLLGAKDQNFCSLSIK